MVKKELKDLTKEELIKEIENRDELIKKFSVEILGLEHLLKITSTFIKQ